MHITVLFAGAGPYRSTAAPTPAPHRTAATWTDFPAYLRGSGIFRNFVLRSYEKGLNY